MGKLIGADNFENEVIEEKKDCHYCAYACCENAESRCKCYFASLNNDVGASKEAELCKWYTYSGVFPKS